MHTNLKLFDDLFFVGAMADKIELNFDAEEDTGRCLVG